PHLAVWTFVNLLHPWKLPVPTHPRDLRAVSPNGDLLCPTGLGAHLSGPHGEVTDTKGGVVRGVMTPERVRGRTSAGPARQAYLGRGCRATAAPTRVQPRTRLKMNIA